MKYFYEKAKQLYGEANVNMEDYKYNCELPQSKETALIMLADACESSVRSLKEYDPAKVENMINSIFEQRISDGQLDDSELTFKDIKVIKEEFLKFLQGQYHKRIRYPKQEEIENIKLLPV